MKEKPLVREHLTAILKSKVQQLQSDRLVRIPSERNLADEFGVSRLSVRSALKCLIDEGILTQRQGSGTYIRPLLETQAVTFVLSPNIKATDPFYNSLFSELTQYVAKNAIPISIIQTSNKVSPEKNSPIVVIGLQRKKDLASIIKQYEKVIIVQHNPGFPDVCQIYFDDYSIGHKAAEVLIKNGHKRILHLAGPDEYSAARQRRRGFVDALAASNAEVSIMSGQMNWNSGYQIGKEMIASKKLKQFTAAFVANDWMAIGFYQSMKEAGIIIPEEMSIIGCDDIHLSKEIEPKLFTFSLNPKMIITTLFQRIKEWPSSVEEANRHIILQAELIERGSVGQEG